MSNEKVITEIDGYEIISLKKKDCVLLRSPQGANLTIPINLFGKIDNFFNKDLIKKSEDI